MIGNEKLLYMIDTICTNKIDICPSKKIGFSQFKSRLQNALRLSTF